MSDFSVVNSIPEICARHGVKNAIISPGSRNAPLTIAFSNHSDIKCWSISDERSAAFVALGMSQQTKTPTVILCTSGSAAYNYAPAVAEAFFKQLPLIVLTADRPPEWIDQWDGQTIYQKNIFGSHVQYFAELPTQPKHADEVWHYQRLINEALIASTSGVGGPVHLNIPFREPFYPQEEELNQSIPVKIIEQPRSTPKFDSEEFEELCKTWDKTQNKVVLVGQQPLSLELVNILNQFSKNKSIPVLGDVISNIHNVRNGIFHSDLILSNATTKKLEDLQPELVISLGKSLISKDLKLFLRRKTDIKHWHLSSEGVFKDPFQSLTLSIQHDPVDFLNKLYDKSAAGSDSFYNVWQSAEEDALIQLEKAKSLEWSELKAISMLMSRLGSSCNLHLANSMAVRYANFIGLYSKKNEIEVFANRGTSGIDGSTSTAVGAALNSKCENILITGDMAFFYDRNAFWHNYDLPNLKIVLVNNNGGGIFRMIDGPTRFEKAYKTYFETDQRLNAKHLCSEFDFSYYPVNNEEEFMTQIDAFMSDTTTSILEVGTNPDVNKRVYKAFKSQFNLS